jgi:hypothetical protein
VVYVVSQAAIGYLLLSVGHINALKLQLTLSARTFAHILAQWGDLGAALYIKTFLPGLFPCRYIRDVPVIGHCASDQPNRQTGQSVHSGPFRFALDRRPLRHSGKYDSPVSDSESPSHGYRAGDY